MTAKSESTEFQTSSSQSVQTVPSANPTTGKHILAEFWQCQCEKELLVHPQPLLGMLIAAVHDAGLTLVGQAVHEFVQGPTSSSYNTSNDSLNVLTQDLKDQDLSNQAQSGGGVTLSLLLAESHLCLHTWGEYNTVTLDVYVCNVTNDNGSKADALFKACLDIFKPQSHHINSVSRQHNFQT